MDASPLANGWSRSPHLQAAWALAFTGLFYLVSGIATGTFRGLESAA
jgi:hypothetical protein